jgi:hypothetical protein
MTCFAVHPLVLADGIGREMEDEGRKTSIIRPSSSVLRRNTQLIYGSLYLSVQLLGHVSRDKDDPLGNVSGAVG